MKIIYPISLVTFTFSLCTSAQAMKEEEKIAHAKFVQLAAADKQREEAENKEKNDRWCAKINQEYWEHERARIALEERKNREADQWFKIEAERKKRELEQTEWVKQYNQHGYYCSCDEH